MAARRARKLAEERRRTEEAAAKQFLDEEQRQLAGSSGGVDGQDDLFKAPEVSSFGIDFIYVLRLISLFCDVAASE